MGERDEDESIVNCIPSKMKITMIILQWFKLFLRRSLENLSPSYTTCLLYLVGTPHTLVVVTMVTHLNKMTLADLHEALITIR